MITPQQAREIYGFTDCSSREDQMALGLYQDARGLFKSQFFRIIDYSVPLVILFLIAAVLAGIRVGGVSPMLILMFGVMAIVFVPHYMQIWEQRSFNSGMYHLSREMGDHFLIGYGVCARKDVIAHRRLPFPGNDYKLRVRFAKDRYLDDVLIMKELFEQVGEGARVCLLMADSPRARQVVAMPFGAAEQAGGGKKGKLRQFERVDERRVRKLDSSEREYYIQQYQKDMDQWNGNFGKKFRLFGAAAFVCGLAFLFLAMQSMAILCWVMVVCAVFALHAQKKEFREHMGYMKETPELSAVEVTVQREEGYTSDLGTRKRPNSAVHFVDAGDLVLWSLRTAEDLRRFRQGDQAILIIHDKIMLPFHRRNGA